MIGLPFAYAAAGLVFTVIAVSAAFDRSNRKRWNNAAFWALLAASFLFGDAMGDLGNGIAVLALAVIGGVLGLGRGRQGVSDEEERRVRARRLGDALFAPILAISVATFAGSLFLPHLRAGGRPLVDPAQVTVVSLTLGVMVALGLAVVLTRPPPLAIAHEGQRLMDSVGAAAILPQILAALGAVFAVSGVGAAVARVAGAVAPLDNRWAVIAVFCLGMALFTFVMGNAFAAFPVMAAGLGAPVIVRRFGGDPAIMGALGMLAGYCGTLTTPMAAHNIIPTALLELPPGAVIRAQAPTAVIVFCANLAIMAALVFRY
ncbi:MAG TPA: DUF979 family protein [Caulobacteraceae bacterium]|nr:DUF979 family protein [Caulobacteraceae bacterium]